MKYPFKLTKSNIIYFSIISLIVFAYQLRVNSFDGYVVGTIIGSIIGLFLFPLLFALLFWFILGRKKNGGTTTFNIVLSIVVLGQFSNFIQESGEKQKPINDLQEAVSEYKEKTLTSPDSTDINYSELSTKVKKSIDDLIKTSVGEERKVFLKLKNYFKKADSVNVSWNNSYNAFAEPRILDFTRLNEKEEYKFQKKVIQEYIKESENFKSFVQNRVEYLKNQTKNIDKNSKSYKGFIKGLTNKDSIQKPVFIPYINAHIEYGKGMKGIIEILEKENGKWKYENETITFQNSESQITYEKILNTAIENEEIVNELSDKLVEIM
jgi:hypothetical protein